jgi:hypothetical protein
MARAISRARVMISSSRGVRMWERELGGVRLGFIRVILSMKGAKVLGEAVLRGATSRCFASRAHDGSRITIEHVFSGEKENGGGCGKW